MRPLLYILMNYLNNSLKQDTYYYICLTLALNIDKLPSWSLEEAAGQAAVSVATLNRFCKEIGFSNYSTLRFIASISDEKEYEEFDPVYRENKLRAIGMTLQHINEIGSDVFLHIGKMILDCDKVIFFGYGKYLNCALKTQVDLMVHKKQSIARIDPIRQVELIRNIDCDRVVVICTSLGGRTVSGHGLKEAISQRGFPSVLITRSDDESITGFFDEVICIGEDHGYHSGVYGVEYALELITNTFFSELVKRNIYLTGGR